MGRSYPRVKAAGRCIARQHFPGHWSPPLNENTKSMLPEHRHAMFRSGYVRRDLVCQGSVMTILSTWPTGFSSGHS
jgi:hypothetical protein